MLTIKQMFIFSRYSSLNSLLAVPTKMIGRILAHNYLSLEIFEQRKRVKGPINSFENLKKKKKRQTRKNPTIIINISCVI